MIQGIQENFFLDFFVEKVAHLWYTIYLKERAMDKERLKLIVKNMKSLVNCLESEIYSDPESYMDDPDYWKVGLTYSEDQDDDGYTD